MNPQELTKKKANLMHSIMSNKKLSKAFNEAMSSPIGSTKRTQAKTVLSIMKKLGGIRHDGMGGPGPMNGIQNTSSNTGLPDYSNMIIFPATPKFKIRLSSQPSPKTSPQSISSDGKGGPVDGMFSGYKPLTLPNINSSFTFPTTTGSSQNQNNSTNETSGPFSFSSISNITSKPPITAPVASTPSVYSNLSNSVKTTPPPNSTLSSAGINPNTGAPYSSLLSASGSNPPPDATTTTPPTGNKETSVPPPSAHPTPLSPVDPTIKSAQNAVDSNMGPGLFAMGATDKMFGGSLDDYVKKMTTDLQTKYNLSPLETQLSNLKAEKGNLIPTLQTYMSGKDQYLSAIQKMIDQTEGNLMNIDTGDPAIAQRYTNYLKYLYTLKGRQNTRYGNFLNAAISDYNADVEKLSSNYDNVYKQYTDAVSQGVTLASNKYTMIYQAMGDLYNTLDQAPMKAANLETVRQQNIANALVNTQNALKGGAVVNPDSLKDYDEYTKRWTINNGQTDPNGMNGTLDFSQLPENGLVGYFSQVAHQGGDEAAVTEFLRVALGRTLKAYSNDPKKIAEVKKLINDLASYETAVYDVNGGDSNVDSSQKTPISNQLLGTVGNATQGAYENYIKTNITEVRNAVKSLVSNSGGFLGIGTNKPGIQNKTKWLKDHSSLDSNFLETLYSSIDNILKAAPEYASDPSSFLKQLFPTGVDEEDAKNLSKIL